ncbi:DUF2155 domain-containing protein [Yoonia sp.]|uniref:DUF2155 domain-containing protein n=1 Tax=Yoonia sp. TaxID=2212373 RepID=UPI003F6D7BDF
MRIKTMIAVCTVLFAATATAQEVQTAAGGTLRVLDKLTGELTDMSLQVGESSTLGYLQVTLNQCRFPVSNPAGDAYAEVVVRYRDAADPVFAGWMLASSPALNAMDHPRYDVWALRCMTS